VLLQACLRFEMRRPDVPSELPPLLKAFRPHAVLADDERCAGGEWNAAATVRRELPGLPCIVLTERIGDERAAQAVADGAALVLKQDAAQRLPGMLRQARYERNSCVQDGATDTRYRAVTQSAHDAIITADADGIIVDWNSSAERMFGYGGAELAGQPLTLLMPERLRDTHSAGLQRVAAGGETHVIGRTVELDARRSDGAEFPIELSLAQWEIGGNTYFTSLIRDISDRRKTEQALRLRDRALEASVNAVIIAEASAPEFPVVYVNPAFERITGYAASDILGKSLRVMHRDDTGQPGVREMRAAIRERREGHATVRNYRKDGTMYWSEVHLAPIKCGDGGTSHFVAIKYDVTETKRYQAELEFLASRDALTGLANRHLLLDLLRRAITYASRYAHAIWVVYLNLDRFTLLNNTLGHAAGDKVIKEIASRLQTQMRGSDAVARLGGDEFMLVLAEHAGEKLETGVLQRILDQVARPLRLDGSEFFLTCTTGVAAYPGDGDDAETLVKHAGIAMQRAKQSGATNSFQFYRPSMNEDAVDRLRLIAELREAITREEFVLHYQPQVDFRSGGIVGMEALVRWQHPRQGLLLPSRFIRLAEEAGLITAIGTWVMRSACRQTKHWHDLGLGSLRVGINLSARQFAQSELEQSVVAILQETGLDPSCLEIELTESMVMTEVGPAMQIMAGLKALGIQLSIDDFGTGYSSLAYLKRFPIDALKIDRAFVRDIAVDKGDAAIAKAIISMAHTIGIRVIAEGVETEAQCDFLCRNMCDELQGYYFSAALPPAEMEAMLRAGRCLEPHLRRWQEAPRTLLIVDDEPNIVAALKRLLRRDNYRILTAGSGQEGLDVLNANEYAVDVIISDQRMPGMTGVEFLRKARTLYPDTVRIVLSGYTELQSITDAVNEGAIYKFLTKPWDDEQLREHVAEAFRHRKLVDENQRLTIEVQTANQDLAATNRRLSDMLKRGQERIARDETSLGIAREALQRLPLAVLWLDGDGQVALANDAAEAMFQAHGAVPGCAVARLVPELAGALNGGAAPASVRVDGRAYRLTVQEIGPGEQVCGTLLTFTPDGADR
jgi:diguanylate cyclase (GGDEF)-like protein/PAS domain S-box-containing protein